MLEFLKALLLAIHFCYYALMTFQMMLSVILVSVLMILLCPLSLIRHLICRKNQNWLLNLNLIYKTLWSGAGSGLLISMLEKLNWFHLTSLIMLSAVDVKIHRSVLEETLSFKRLRLTLSSKLDCSSYFISIAKIASKKMGALIHSIKFLSPEVALGLYKSTIQPCMEYCCHV